MCVADSQSTAYLAKAAPTAAWVQVSIDANNMHLDWNISRSGIQLYAHSATPLYVNTEKIDTKVLITLTNNTYERTL